MPSENNHTKPTDTIVSSARRILLVEDVEVNRKVAIALLQREGYEVEVAETGAEGVAKAGSGDFAIILMDILLPDFDGAEATRQIRSFPDETRRKTPILALTASLFPDDLASYRDAGMNGLVAKPIEASKFRSVLRRLESGFDFFQEAPPTNDEDPALLDIAFLEERWRVLGQEQFQMIFELGRGSMRAVLDKIKEARLSRDLTRLGAAGHSLAGAASNFGYSALLHMGLKTENAAECGDLRKAMALTENFEDLARSTAEQATQWLARQSAPSRCQKNDTAP